MDGRLHLGGCAAEEDEKNSIIRRGFIFFVVFCSYLSGCARSLSLGFSVLFYRILMTCCYSGMSRGVRMLTIVNIFLSFVLRDAVL